MVRFSFLYVNPIKNEILYQFIDRWKKKCMIRFGMLGTTEGRRFLGPSGSQTHQHPFLQYPFPFPPYPNFHHLAALHASGSGIPIATTSQAHTSLWPGSPTLSSTTGPLTTPTSAIGGRLSAFDFQSNREGELLFYLLFSIYLV